MKILSPTSMNGRASVGFLKKKKKKEMKMRILSAFALLIFAFVGGNLLLGTYFNARSTVKYSDATYGPVELNDRRLKERGYAFTTRKTRGLENVRTNDYQPVDPSPSSKATTRAGPIEHGTPLLPYVPRYTPPPGHPKDMAPAHSPGHPKDMAPAYSPASENVRTNDYQPVDPSPSSKATTRAGPIEHGTPLLPYVPRYTPPPGHPKDMAPAHSPASPVT